ncbi:carbamoyl phosphate synthase small subunit [Aureibacillus halotolerans]|uniref:Carbamoyl phosphate synthase small chain n=1 Tax=Aureibacillus halotolerans TaxID=1508390 RepID=A0A4R6U6H4_9BACI|nr:carbamoyl phosphate synthase small subunit [Aureibacillus halotolerans]TDQ42108.1 carbamoyl-phosphate synthase small subunit [Aureibacillus halotolerans]
MKGYLHLANEETYEGIWIDGAKAVHGEVVFFTGMTGYQEVITDPSFRGQIVVFTYPLIGNYGVNEVDMESDDIQVNGVVISEMSAEGHHYESVKSFQQWLVEKNIPVLLGADTRDIVKAIRSEGMMGGQLSPAPTPHWEGYLTIEEQELVQEASVSSQELYPGQGDHVVLVDFGYKHSIRKQLQELGCKVTVVPYNIALDELKQLQPDGVVFSNGPGDPEQMHPYLPTMKQLSLTYPTLAICLGHQLMALAHGGTTSKLKFGHRGANQPVFDKKLNKVFMTSQNHSFVVDEDSMQNSAFEMRFHNVNDGSAEGMVHQNKPILSVQFHPEAKPGPEDSRWMFAEFLKMMDAVRGEKVYA